MFYTIYETTNKINGKIYIGKHETNNLDDDYLGSGKLLWRAIKKYGKEHFEKKILFVFDNQKDMLAKEKELVDKQFIKRKDTYNLKEGGIGGWDHMNSDEGVRYRKSSPNWMNWSKSGTKAYLEKLKNDPVFAAKQKAHAQKSIKLATDAIRGKPSHFRGKTHTDEVKKRIGKINSKIQKGEGNSQFGTCWIYNIELKQNKKIQRTDLIKWLESGWWKGRRIQF